MRRHLAVAVLTILLAGVAGAQTFPAPTYFQKFWAKPAMPTQVPGPRGLEDYVKDGKLRLGLEDMIALTLANNTDVRINSLTLETSAFALQRAYQPFDPMLISSFRPTRSTTPATSELEGAQIPSSLTHSASFGYSQTFQTGTNMSVNLSSNRSSSNNQYAFFNPSYNSALTFQFTQPLLRRRGFLYNRAPIVIAQRNLKMSRADFEASLNDTISRAINQYWDLVQSRQELEVLRKSLDLANESYKRDKRALELGALPPLDIYRSESQVAQRKLAVVQAEYRLKQAEDDFRRTVGADLDPNFSALPLDLTETAQTSGELPVIDPKEAMDKALASRPELESLRQQAANDDTNAKVATQNLKPDFNLTGFYTTNGTGGNLIDTDTDGNPYVKSRGGLADALDQLSGFKYPTYGITLELRLPLRNRAASADLGTALVNRRRTLYSMRQRQQAITLEVRNAVNQIEGAKEAIQAAQVSLELARKNLEAEQRKYELGAETIFFVLDAQNQLAQTEQSMVEAQISYQRALTALDRATGDLLSKHRVQIANISN